MRRFFALMLLTMVVIIFSACNSAEKQPEYFMAGMPYEFGPFEEYLKAQAETEYPKGTKLTAEENKMFEEVLYKLLDYYSLDREIPEVRKLTKAEMQTLTGNHTGTIITGTYNAEQKCMYVLENSFETDIPTIAHELMHYLSDNGDKCHGMVYEKEGLRIGRDFDEGVTNYLSTQVFPFPKGNCVYEYHTHTAKLFALAVGEDNLRNAYFSSDVESLRVDFNNCVKKELFSQSDEGFGLSLCDSYDLFNKSLSAHNFWLMCGGDENNADMLMCAMVEADNSEEMLMFYGNAKGGEVRKAMSNELKNFIKNEYLISWSTYSNLPNILQEWR